MNGAPEPRTRPTDGPAFLPGLSVAISVEDPTWHDKGLGDIEALSLAAMSAAARRAGLAENVVTEASLTFAGDADVKAINAEWRGKDMATNVLSFPMLALQPGDAPGPMLGDLVFALETIEREAAGEGKSFHDHLCHLIVHGFMHCLGFDHVEAGDADAMERLEIDILADLGIEDPYAETEPEGAHPHATSLQPTIEGR